MRARAEASDGEGPEREGEAGGDAVEHETNYDRRGTREASEPEKSESYREKLRERIVSDGTAGARGTFLSTAP